ncbi:hypothetical protein [Rhizobacter sp. LjRoot28]|jgi:hypothetical protein|uniref:hypothetical protein n=1 Tax=Rhizobacter sp. LjRoot28 TaxID=3342309 RepID=UPI003ECF1DB5
MPARFSAERTLADLRLDFEGRNVTGFLKRLRVHDRAPSAASVRVTVTPPVHQGLRRGVTPRLAG